VRGAAVAFKQKAIVNARLDQLSKAELIRTVKKLRARETKLLNRIAALEAELVSRAHPHELSAPVPFPWEAKT
jgi:hypothetical protein